MCFSLLSVQSLARTVSLIVFSSAGDRNAQPDGNKHHQLHGLCAPTSFSRVTGECEASVLLLTLAGPQVSTRLGHTYQLLWDCRRAWGQSMPTVASKVDGEHRNGTQQHLFSQRERQQAPATPTDVLRLANESPSHMIYVLFKLLLLCWVPG